VDQLQILGPCDVDSLNSSLLGFCDDMLFTDDHEVGFVSQEGKHDQICVGTIEAMSCIWIVVLLHFQISNVIHHFMLTFSWH